MSTLSDGQSEFDTLTIRLTDSGIEVTSVETFHRPANVTTPCDAWQATVVPADPLTDSLLKPGAGIQILVNGHLQLTGYIDKRENKSGRQGAHVAISGRDTMGPIVDASVDPKFKVLETMTLGDVIGAVLAPLGITKVYNDGSLNQKIQTGAIGLSAAQFNNLQAAVQVPSSSLDDAGNLVTTYATTNVTLATSPKAPGLATIKLKKLQPHVGEGVHAFCDRILKRNGLRMRAAADGTGVVVDKPDFDSAPLQTLIHSTEDGTLNNVTDASVVYDATTQPACIVATGRGSADPETPAAGLCVIAINELAGTDPQGNPLQAVRDILAKYPDAQILTMRDPLLAARSNFAPTLPARPIYVKDDESKSGLDLVGFVRHKMADFQHRAVVGHYTVEGWSQNGVPYAINTQVTIEDVPNGLSQTMYVLECEFEKSRQGTFTKLVVILPHSYDLTADQ